MLIGISVFFFWVRHQGLVRLAVGYHESLEQKQKKLPDSNSLSCVATTSIMIRHTHISCIVCMHIRRLLKQGAGITFSEGIRSDKGAGREAHRCAQKAVP